MQKLAALPPKKCFCLIVLLIINSFWLKKKFWPSISDIKYNLEQVRKCFIQQSLVGFPRLAMIPNEWEFQPWAGRKSCYSEMWLSHKGHIQIPERKWDASYSVKGQVLNSLPGAGCTLLPRMDASCHVASFPWRPHLANCLCSAMAYIPQVPSAREN